MPKAKFTTIYQDIKHDIYTGVYTYQAILPSESEFTATYGCSRNTVRRALSMLTDEGWLLPIHGKGVRVIYRKDDTAQFTVGGIETFKETSARNHFQTHTEVLDFREIVVDKKLAEISGFSIGTEVYKVDRLRHINGQALILDYNYFRKDIVTGLTPEIASDSIYEYMEKTLNIIITTSNRRITVEPISSKEAKYIDTGDYNCLAVMTSITFDKQGKQVEYTRSCHHPDHFCFYDTATR